MKEMRTGLSRKIRHEYKRVLAFMLSFMMLFTNVGSNVSIALAANAVPTVSATFKLTGEEIREAAQEAIEGGDFFDLASLELSTKDATLMSKYERLFGDGYVFEIFPEINDESVPAGTELRTFIRIDSMEEEGYQITGDEEIVFLFVNSSAQRVQFYADVDGYITSRVTVDGHKSAVQTPSNATPVPEETTAPEKDTKPEAGDGTAAETTAPVETAPVESTPAADETLPEESVEVEESSTADETEAATSEASTEASIESTTEASGEIQETETTVEDTAGVTEAADETEATTEAEEPETTTEAAEPETEAVEEDAEDGELTVGLSQNVVALVAAPEGEDAGDAAEEATVAEEPEAEPETEAEIVETEADVVETEKAEAIEETKEDISGTEKAAESVDEVETPEVAGEEDEAVVVAPTKAVKETTAAASDDDDYFIPEDKEYYDGIELIDDVTPEEEMLNDENHGGSIKGTTYNQVEMGDDAYARAFKTTLNDLHVDVIAEPEMLMMPMMLSLYSEEQVSVTLRKSDGKPDETVSIVVGTIEDNIPEVKGYEFDKAMVDNTIIKVVAVDGDQGDVYVATELNQITGTLVEKSTDIVLYYQPIITRHDITYTVTVDGKPVSGSSSPAEIIGVSRVESGDNLEFSFTLEEGYSVDKVTYKTGTNSLEVKADANGVYTVKNVRGSIAVVIALKKIPNII